MGKKSRGNSYSGKRERLGFNGTHSNSKIKRNRHRKNKGVAVSWSIKVRQRNKAEWEFVQRLKQKIIALPINLCTHILMLLYNKYFWNMNKLWSLPLPYWGLVFLVFILFFFFLSQIHRSFSFVLFCFLAFLNSLPTYSLTPRSALFLFRLRVSFILPQSLLSGLLSIPESGRNQVNEGNTQSFGSMRKQWDANFYQARGHFNPKCWKS